MAQKLEYLRDLGRIFCFWSRDAVAFEFFSSLLDQMSVLRR